MKTSFMPWTMVVFLCPHVCSVRAAEDGSQHWQLDAFRQRASFELSGRVIDETGNALEGTLLEITTWQYDPATTETRTTREVVAVDKEFRLLRKDVTGVHVEARKEGYQSASFEKRFIELFNGSLGKGTKTTAEVAAGSEKRVEPFRDLKYQNHQVLLALRKVSPRSVALSRQRFDFKVDGRSPRCLIPIDLTGEATDGVTRGPLGEDLKTQAESYLVVSIEGKEGEMNRPHLHLSCENGGGIVLCEPATEIHSMLEAPEEGFQQTIDLSHVDPDRLFSFYLKTHNGCFGKGTANMCYFDAERQRGRVLVGTFAIQTNGTRSLVTNSP